MKRIAALALVSMWLAGMAGCSTISPQAADQRPFFQDEYARQSHGRKTWFDRLFELDPSEINVDVAPEFTSNPPAKIAILPFIDQGSAQFIVDKVPLTFRDKKERAEWAWTDSQRLRRNMQGYLAGREFLAENLTVIDTVLAAHGIKDGDDLNRVSPRQLGQWLGVDAVVHGTILHYESYYAFLIAGQQVSIEGRIVSTHDGNTLVSFYASRDRTNLMPAIDPVDMVIDSMQTLMDLRDIQIARSEDEACREVVIRIPASKQLREQLVHEASDMVVQQGTDLPAEAPAVADSLAPRPN